MIANKFIRLPFTRELLARIFSKIKISTTNFYNGDPCWDWTAGTRKGGYGRLTYNKTGQAAHRIIYQLFVEEVPPELECDHLCRRPVCVNPVHIEPVTPQINVLRSPITPAAINAAKTHCLRGHPFSGENLRIKRGYRVCRLCTRMEARDSKAAIRALPADHPRRIRALRMKRLATRRQRASQKQLVE